MFFSCKVGINSRRKWKKKLSLTSFVEKKLKWIQNPNRFQDWKSQKFLCRDFRIGATLSVGKDRKMFPDNFLTPPEFTLLKELEKIRRECSPEKAVQKEQTEDSIMFLQKCLRKDFLRLLIPWLYTDKIQRFHPIFMEKLEMREFPSRLWMMRKNSIPVLIWLMQWLRSRWRLMVPLRCCWHFLWMPQSTKTVKNTSKKIIFGIKLNKNSRKNLMIKVWKDLPIMVNYRLPIMV